MEIFWITLALCAVALVLCIGAPVCGIFIPIGHGFEIVGFALSPVALMVEKDPE